MQKISEKIVKFRYVILAISILLLIPSAIGFINTRINYDILYYLPHDIETMKGQDVLIDEFGKGAYGMFIVNGMNTSDRMKLADKIKAIDHVSEVICYDSLVDGKIPVEALPEKAKKIFFSDKGSMMMIFFDTTSSADETMKAIEEIRKVGDKQCFLSGMAAIVTDTKNMVQDQIVSYTLIAIVLALIVLMITMDSFLVPILFLLSIGMTIIYNLGTNFIAGEISFITMALVAVLQLGVTMDYSIFLYHSYKEQCGNYEKKTDAMAAAITATITSVSGSSLTTIAGFFAMCFMAFTLGKDMGIVMMKGVAFGVIGCVTILPAMILIFDKAIWKTTHKTFHIPAKGLSKIVTKWYIPISIIMLLLWVPSLIGYKNIDVYYKLDKALPSYLPSVQGNKELEEGYEMSSVSMILCDSKLSQVQTKKMIDEINALPGVSIAAGLDSIKGALIPEEMIPDSLRSKLESENHKMLVVSSEYEIATDELNDQCKTINDIIKKYDENAMLVGEGPATKDLIEITDRDFKVVSAISIGAIFLLILFVLKSVSLPFILVFVIELAIYINMSMAFFLGTTLPFIASICVGTIQLGATVDYAILMTNRYKTERIAGKDKKEAVKIAVITSINSIISSALGFFAATIGVAVYSDVDLIGSICMLLARGAIISMLIVLTLLPALLVLCDGIIIRTTLGMKDCKMKKGSI
ncbi:MAG: MMPL family transporter [Lachnospiraceae bacterium]|nr:MMPL family transporter [Lachnospiraceae bacterium]